MTKSKRTDLSGALFMGFALCILCYFVKSKYILTLFIGLCFMAFTYFHPMIGLLSTLFGYIFLPDILSLAFVLGITFMYLFRSFMTGDTIVKPERQERVFFVFFIYLILSTIFSTYVKGSIRDLGIHLGGFCLFIILLTELKNKERIYSALTILSLATTLIALYGISQYFTGVEIKKEWVDVANNPDLKVRIFSVFGNPNIFAEYLVLFLPISVGLFWSAKKDSQKIFYLGQFLIGVIALGLTMSRGGWLGLMVAAAFFLFFVEKRFFLLAVPIGAFIFYKLPEGILRRITSIFNFADSSTAYRFKMWEITGDIIRDYPIIGVGLGHLPFKRMFETYIRTMPIYHAHNTFLEVLAEMGVLGLLLFLILIGNVYYFGTKTLLRNKDPFYQVMGAALLAGFTGALFHGMFENLLYLMKITTTFWILMALIFALGRVALREQEESKDDGNEEIHTL
ncbi:MAG: O-antigen ligase family protein [Tissierellia bacterium]|nr:O-antigen ligase family protein [Tissierellia bacterium]